MIYSSAWRKHSKLFTGKRGLEIGGPSEIFSPIYKQCSSCDGVNFSSDTTWWVKGDSNAYTFKGKTLGKVFIADAVNMDVVPSAGYDFVMSSNNLEHIANPIKALKEFLRAAKPGGGIIIVVPAKKYMFDHKREYTSFEHMLSDFENNMQEDARNTIIVLKNFDGENLGEFRRNLATFGAIKVRSDGEAGVGVDTLTITVNGENYKSVLELLKKAIIENGKGFDAKSDRLGANPNQMNIQSMYSDIDLDANGMEVELQAAFDDLLWFVDCHLSHISGANYFDEPADIIFNLDVNCHQVSACRVSDCSYTVSIFHHSTVSWVCKVIHYFF